MMRSLWSAASGMTNQQLNVDTIANNIANVNTVGYKKERLEFKTLLYETMQRADLDAANQTGRPVNLQVGHGVRAVVTSRMFTPGNLESTSNDLDFAIEGDGFFVVQRGEDDIVYSRDGSLKAAIVEDGLMITTSDGYPVLSTEGEPIILDAEILMSDVTVNEEGEFFHRDAENQYVPLDFQFELVQFSNRQGLEAVGGNFYQTTPASGEALSESQGDTVRRSRIRQKFLEMSNVSVADEMVNLIVAQRAYELNSRVITTSDEMLQQANTLKR
ncbi:MAG: flagellar basal-body rod protein FlgG [Clostridiales bacterium]|jgi:flagellar basal-body rod protein FlgG|nr:flagellar basal-body rod protein FlgG [Clostridiales bacterium]